VTVKAAMVKVRTLAAKVPMATTQRCAPRRPKAVKAAAGAADDGKGGEGGDDDADLMKSLGLKPTKVTVDGKDVEAFDGAQLVKSLMTQNAALKASNQETQQALKSLIEQNIALAKQVQTIHKSVSAIASSGRGRKSATVVVSGGDGGDGGEQKPKGMAPREFLSKALDAQRAGRITAQEVAEAESHIGHGMQVPERITSKVLAA
jgi:hypothetical protein